jgi:hypothetical protein
MNICQKVGGREGRGSPPGASGSEKVLDRAEGGFEAGPTDDIERARIQSNGLKREPSALDSSSSALERSSTAPGLFPGRLELKPTALESCSSALELKSSAPESNPGRVNLESGALESNPGRPRLEPGALEVRSNGVKLKTGPLGFNRLE